MKSNIDMFQGTMIGKIAGVHFEPNLYREYYKDACADLNNRVRRIKSSYLFEKLIANGLLEDFEYKYIYDASATNHFKKFLFNALPILIISFLNLSWFFKAIALFLSFLLFISSLYHLSWCVRLFNFKEKSFWIKGCYYLNLIINCGNLLVLFICLKKLL